jgi:hypothetical protein
VGGLGVMAVGQYVGCGWGITGGGVGGNMWYRAGAW